MNLQCPLANIAATLSDSTAGAGAVVQSDVFLREVAAVHDDACATTRRPKHGDQLRPLPADRRAQRRAQTSESGKIKNGIEHA